MAGWRAAKIGLLLFTCMLCPHLSLLQMLPECPGFGTDVEDDMCTLWRESVESIPYEARASTPSSHSHCPFVSTHSNT
jgi:hypothetical protein